MDFINTEKFETAIRQFGWYRISCKKCRECYNSGRITKYGNNNIVRIKAAEWAKEHKCKKKIGDVNEDNS